MTQGFHSFDSPVRIDSFQPHGHFRLAAMTLEIFYPDTGKLELISSVSNWTNRWHTSHIYADDAAPLVPKGAVLVITGYYDNTSANPNNPDPDQWVGVGSRTADEMSHEVPFGRLVRASEVVVPGAPKQFLESGYAAQGNEESREHLPIIESRISDRRNSSMEKRRTSTEQTPAAPGRTYPPGRAGKILSKFSPNILAVDCFSIPNSSSAVRCAP